MRSFSSLAVSLLLALVLSACGVSSGSDATAPSGDGVAVDLDFTSTTVAGEPFEGSDLAGKPTVLWFWAPWCSTCRTQEPTVSKLAEEYGDDVNVVGIGSQDTAEAIEAFAAETSSEIVQLTDPDGEVWRHLEVTTVSSYLVLDAEGDQVERGSLSNDELTDLVAELAG